MRRTLAVLIQTIAILASGSLAGCLLTEDTPALPKPTRVQLVDDAFTPDSIEVRVGNEVVWTNNGTRWHTVTVAAGNNGTDGTLVDPQDPGLGPGDTLSFVFAQPGDHVVYCRYHSSGAEGNFSQGMVMRMIVT